MDWRYEVGRIFYTNSSNEILAEATFVPIKSGEVQIDNTYVHPSLRGQGVAGKMLEALAKHLRERGLKVSASCSYANSWLKNNREEYADIISDDIDDGIVACKMDGRR